MKIKIFPYQAHCFATGGFENLMNSTFNSIQSLGVSISKIDIWAKDSDFDIAHFWGLGVANFTNIIWAKKDHKKIIVTCILPSFTTFNQKIRFFISKTIGRQKMLFDVLNHIDVLVVTSKRSKSVAIKYYKFPSDRVYIIPNTILASYYNNLDNNKVNPLIKIKDYAFTIGSVCKRKNQIKLALACLEIDVNLLIIGPVMSGEEDYGAELELLISKSNRIVWIKNMKRDSIELINAYKNAILFALPSFEEEQPTSAQEAGLLGKPLLLGDRQYANQIFYKNAYLAEPNSINSIAKGLKSIIESPNRFIPPYSVFSACKEENVAREYIKIYETTNKFQ